jgi:hypothetical protein
MSFAAGSNLGVVRALVYYAKWVRYKTFFCGVIISIFIDLKLQMWPFIRLKLQDIGAASKIIDYKAL